MHKSIEVVIFPDGRLDVPNASDYLGLSQKTLAMMRCQGTGPEFIKRGRIFYFQGGPGSMDFEGWETIQHRQRSLKMQSDLKKNLVKQDSAATYLGLSEATLERDRWRGGDIPYIKVGPRAIRYDLNQLDTYLETKTVRKEVLHHG